MAGAALTRYMRGAVVDSHGREAIDLLERSRRLGAQLITTCEPGSVAVVCGLLRSISLRPMGDAMAFEADLFDGTGELTLIWLGRYRIAGVRAGSAMRVRGRVIRRNGRCTMFNPAYSLIAAHAGGPAAR